MWFLPTARVLLGSFLALISGFGLILNFLTLIPVFRMAFVTRKNQVYIIAFFNICTDIVQMSLATFYLAPAIIAHSFLVAEHKKEKWTLFLGSMFMFCWYFETVTQMVMAVNRFVVICLQRHHLFTFTTTLLIFLSLIPICFLAMYTSQYTNPCCSFLFDQEIMGWSYYEIPGVHNYSNDLDLPLNMTSTIVSGLCYVCIFINIHQSSVVQNKARRKRDIRYSIQFSVILLFYMFTWVLFRILPEILKGGNIEWFFLIPFCFTINCSSNALIYLGFNFEVQNNVWPRFFRRFLTNRFERPSECHLTPQTTQKRDSETLGVAPTVSTSQVSVWSVRRHQPFRNIRLGGTV